MGGPGRQAAAGRRPAHAAGPGPRAPRATAGPGRLAATAAEIEKAIGYDGDDAKQIELAGHLKSLWNSETKSFKAWDYNNPEGLCGTQQPCPREEAFAYLFKKYATDEVVDIMNQEAYRSGRAYLPETEIDIQQDFQIKDEQ